MQIQLNQAEIETAVNEYVANQGIKIEGKVLTLKFQMTRGEQGLIGELSIDDIKPETPVTVTSAPVKERAKPGPKPGTVGEKIANQADKAVTATVNKLPETATAAVNEAKQKAAETSTAGNTLFGDTKETVVESEQAAEATEEVAASTTAEASEEVKPASTISLFGG